MKDDIEEMEEVEEESELRGRFFSDKRTDVAKGGGGEVAIGS